MLAIGKLFVIVLLGFVLYRRGYLKEDALSFLTFFLVNFSVPCLIFSNIITTFEYSKMPSVVVFLGISLVIFLLGLGLGYFFSFSITPLLRREVIALVSFQNCGYLPMNLALFLLDIQKQRIFLNYIFVYILGFNILMWSVAGYLILKKPKSRFNVNSLFTPPVLSVAISLIVVYSGFRRFIPTFVLSPVEMIGQTSFVLSMIVLGGWLAKGHLRKYIKDTTVIKVAMLKLIVLPLIIFVAILKLHLYSLLGLFIIMEASMPSAASLPIVAKIHSADSKFISYGVFATHIISVFTIPVWIELFARVSGFNF